MSSFAAAVLCLLAQQAPVKVEVPGTSVAFDLVEVPAGALKPYRLATRETTWADFNAFFETKDAAVDATTRPTRAIAYFGQVGVPANFLEPKKPATNLRWHSAVAYCDWLSKKTGMYFRLPTEPEWEHAAKAGGDGAPAEDQAWHKGNSGDRTHDAGEKKPNAWGLYDMAGNLWEYVLEFHDGGEFDPVVKGGCWSTPAADLKIARRQKIPLNWFEEDPNRPRSVWWLTNKDQSQGIRVACVADASDKDARAAAAAKVEVKILGKAEKVRLVPADSVKGKDGKEEKAKDAQTLFIELDVEIKNGSDRVLDEAEILVYYLDPKGKPHLADIAGANKAGQATFTKAWPVLANSVREAARAPLKPGETRKFKADVPQSFDGDDDVDHEKFAGKATNVRLAK